MSHSKFYKGGYSLYLENWNPSAKKYIRTCALCGKTGYSPAIDAPDFGHDTKNKVIAAELKRTLSPLELDALQRCPVCANVQSRSGQHN